MRISFGTRAKSVGALNSSNGYGVATIGMLNSLERLGYQVEPNDASADVEIWFDQPHHWNFSNGPYRIGYHPWESTLLLPGWAEIMNECDEIWTPSDLIADWYVRYAGVKVPVYVYEHGIEHFWTPKKRTVKDKLRFLHVGAEATRKGGWDTVTLFRAAFGNSKDYGLTLKMVGANWNGVRELGPITYNNERISMREMVELYHEHHVFVYPSFGEGFGLNPFQAIATGMPAIVPHEWAPYRRYLDPKLRIGTTLEDSLWTEIHPGKVLRPSFDDVVDRLRYAADNYDQLHRDALSRTDAIHLDYDWDALTGPMFKDLETRLKG